MSDVLVLGNGISRLLHTEFVLGWSGELWACNRAYLEEDLAPKITLLTGHADVLTEAAEYRNQHGLSFKILHGLLGQRGDEHPITCPGEFRKDSGTTLIAQAHEDGFICIYVCGFDLGGPDIWSPLLEFQNKHVWVRRWRHLIEHYGSDRIAFIGYDHMPYLQSKLSEQLYMRRYQRRIPHIPDPDYVALHQMIFGPSRGLKGEHIMKVEFISGPRIGFRTQMSEAVALVYAAKGKVKILGTKQETPLPDSGDQEVAASADVTTRMSVGTLREVARLRGVEGAEKMKKAELLELLR